jgi:hypothetical protein
MTWTVSAMPTASVSITAIITNEVTGNPSHEVMPTIQTTLRTTMTIGHTIALSDLKKNHSSSIMISSATALSMPISLIICRLFSAAAVLPTA